MLPSLYQPVYRTKSTPSKPKTQARRLEELIGNTPLLDLSRTAAAHGLPETVKLFAKAEWFNPGGSVKDRPALNIIRTAERDGSLTHDKILLDATSGNTGIAYAMIGAARGYRVKLALPAGVSPERKAILRAYGAELILTDPAQGADGAIREVHRLKATDPIYFHADQYNNPANWMAHYKTTANEIWRQTGGTLTHFIAGMGTSGTFMGNTRRLRELNPAIRFISIQPDIPQNRIEGIKHMDTEIRPGIYDETLADENVIVSTETAQAMARELARTEGVFVGVSAGAAVATAVRYAQENNLKEAVIVTVLPDNGFKYLSEPFWNEA
ncbi:MAG: cysteine synthase family protein [Anaerolineae bacterium]|nr:cysteine synthase family protein [Anaerolineae bacterium]